LKPDEYLIRPEAIALHESDTAFNVNPGRGVQLYMECIQFKVVSSGSIALGEGIDFKKAYTYSDPGLVFDLYNAAPNTYVPPGGPVSSIAAAGQLGIGPIPAAGSAPNKGAAPPAPKAPAAAPKPINPTAPPATPTNPPTTSRSPLPTGKMVKVPTPSTPPSDKKPAAIPAPGSCAKASVDDSNRSNAPVAKWDRCGGINYTGSTECVAGTKCVVWNPWYSQCV
jgi:cellulase